jgi:hypothetical protein
VWSVPRLNINVDPNIEIVMITFTPEQEQFMQLAQTRAYYQGMREGVERFAWWQDGTQYVGTTGAKLKSVLQDIDTFEADDLARYSMLKAL